MVSTSLNFVLINSAKEAIVNPRIVLEFSNMCIVNTYSVGCLHVTRFMQWEI